MAGCTVDQIKKNLYRPCDPPSQGVRPLIYLTYVSNIIGISYKAGSNNKVIEGLNLKTDAKLIKLEGFKMSNALSLGLNITDYANYVTHNAQLVVFDRSASGREQVDALKDADDLVVISREKALTGNWEAYGINAGMSCTNLQSALNDPNGGAYILDFAAGLEVKTPPIIKKLGAGGLDETDTYLASLALADVV